MKQVLFKWFRMGLVALAILLLPVNRSWPPNVEPAPTLSLASAWFCEHMANGLGGDVVRDGLRVRSVNPSDNYRLDFRVTGAWEIKATFLALLFLLVYLLFVGRFTFLGLAVCLGMMVLVHLFRLSIMSWVPIGNISGLVDSITGFGYMIVTCFSTITFLNFKCAPCNKENVQQND